MKMFVIVLIFLAVIAGVFIGLMNYDWESGSAAKSASSGAPTEPRSKNLATLKTNFGEIQFEMYENDAPKAVINFLTLANKGYYDGLIFHRVIKGFMIQGGDPNCSKGTGPCGAGGPGYVFEDELNPDTDSYKRGYVKGAVAMANAGPDTNGSQFFIMLKDTSLPHNYTIFGKVVKGQEAVDSIGSAKTDKNDRPVSPIIIEETRVEQ